MKVLKIISWTARDFRWSVRQLIVNEIAGARLVPRVVRHMIYRVMGLDIAALDVSSGVIIVGGRGVSIGEGTFLNHGVYLDVAGGIRLGRDCAVAPRVTILSSTHPIGATGWSHDIETAPVTIGDNVWLGAGATVLPGSEIGDNCVVAAQSLVRGRLTDPGVYGGIPAKLIRPFADSGPRLARDADTPAI